MDDISMRERERERDKISLDCGSYCSSYTNNIYLMVCMHYAKTGAIKEKTHQQSCVNVFVFFNGCNFLQFAKLKRSDDKVSNQKGTSVIKLLVSMPVGIYW